MTAKIAHIFILFSIGSRVSLFSCFITRQCLLYDWYSKCAEQFFIKPNCLLEFFGCGYASCIEGLQSSDLKKVLFLSSFHTFSVLFSTLQFPFLVISLKVTCVSFQSSQACNWVLDSLTLLPSWKHCQCFMVNPGIAYNYSRCFVTNHTMNKIQSSVIISALKC